MIEHAYKTPMIIAALHDTCLIETAKDQLGHDVLESPPYFKSEIRSLPSIAWHCPRHETDVILVAFPKVAQHAA